MEKYIRFLIAFYTDDEIQASEFKALVDGGSRLPYNLHKQETVILVLLY